MTTGQELRLYKLAETLGVEIALDLYGVLQPTDLGGWFPRQRGILLRPGMGHRNRLHTLAHELGHAIHNHPEKPNQKQERQADDFAANLLIDTQKYRECEIMFDGNEGAIAQELEVTLSLLKHWKSIQERQAV